MSVTVRSKWAIANYGLAIAAALLLVGALALAGAWSVYSDPPTREVTETVSEQRFATGMETSAVVTGQTGLYRTGQTLRNRPVYFFNATPRVSVAVTTSVPDGERVAVDKRLVLRHRAEREGDPFWESRRVLGAANETVTDGEVTMETGIDMRAVGETVRERRAEIGSVGTVRSELVLRVDYESRNHSDRLTSNSTVVLTERAYWFDEPLAANRTHSVTDTRTVSEPPDVGAAARLAGAGVLALGLAAGVVWFRGRGIDVGTVEAELTRKRYDEWISRGEIPTKAEKQYIRIDTLEDLVDIAIDSNKRVIYDTDYDAYGVVDRDLVYYYAEGETEFVQWLDV